MSYVNHDGLAYFKNKLTQWVNDNYLNKTSTGNSTIAGNVTFTNPITGDVDGKTKKDWLGQKIDETYIKSIATNDNAGTIVYTKGNGSTNHILIDLLQGATPIANGKAGLVPAPTVSEMNYFLRGDGNWAVPTDVYVNQNLIASSNNNQFPVLLSGTSGAPATKTNATVGYTNVVSVNPLTNALMASQFISKHPTYNRQSTVTSKVQYSLNFTDVVSGVGHNLGEIVGYVDTLASGGEHELGLRLFGNPNVQGTEEDYVYMGVGLSKTNIAYGHAPSTPLPTDHNEPTDIITRDWLARNGSETGLVHTTMNETIDGAKTFKKTVTINSGDNNNKAGLTVQGNASVGGNSTVAGNSSISGNETVGGTLTSTGKLTVNGTAEIKGGSGNTPSLLVTGNETVTGKLTGTGTAEFSGGSGNTPTLTVNGNESVSGNSSVGGNSSITGNETVGGNISTTNGNISTANGTVSGKTGSIGSGGLTVAGTTTSTGKITGSGGAEISGGSGLKVNGNETVTGTTTVTGKITGNNGAEISGGNGLIVNGNETVNGEIYKVVNNTPQEYVSYVTNQQSTRETIVNNMIKNNGGLAIDSNKEIYVKLSPTGGVKLSDNGELYVDFSLDSSASVEAQAAANRMKEQLLSSLGIQIPLTGNMVLYVNKEHSNATNTWRNSQGVIDKTVGTIDKPFKSINAAIQCATQGYSIGTYHIDIVIAKSSDAGYNEFIVLPEFSHTTGYIALVSADMSNSSAFSVITNKATNDSAAKPNQTLCFCTGSGWVLTHLKFDCACNEENNGIDVFPSCVAVDGSGKVRIAHCILNQEYTGNAPVSRYVIMRTISVYSGGYAEFALEENKPTYINTVLGNASSCAVFFTERQGQILFEPTNLGDADSTWHNIQLSGSASVIFEARVNSTIICNGGSLYYTGFSGTITGKKCITERLSTIMLYNVANTIGDEAGTNSSATYCTVSPSSLLE